MYAVPVFMSRPGVAFVALWLGLSACGAWAQEAFSAAPGP
jgi:hypothetical protein